MSDPIIVKRLHLEQVVELIDWAKDEGWNPGLDDAKAFYAADRQGFLGCFVDDKLAAGIASVAYDEQFGFIGLYITRPDFRGKGLGLRVWNAGMTYLGDRTIGLDGVPEQQQNYANMGFVSAYGTARWSGRCVEDQVMDMEVIFPINAKWRDHIVAFERNLFPAARPAFLDVWLSPSHTGFAIMRAGQIAGYAIVRSCHDGAKLGPLFASDVEDARKLFHAIARTMAGAELHIDVPDHQSGFTHYLQKLGFQKGFATARMYKGKPPSIDMDRVFAVTSLELG